MKIIICLVVGCFVVMMVLYLIFYITWLRWQADEIKVLCDAGEPGA